ncbi:alternative ribosome-rescue factor [Colwellia sp. PAMC 20917]|uniref:alternative ribosome rescue factor ArfA n=1 Tax=unclassified Colwellia TaxID=196834 RepID=UPI000878B344|nr:MULTISPECIES: alternative ribosome rescue factor ArfA [unclassified Colwellia]MBA6363241.1 ribosome alternative rescue factor ArfA [Colwellia sp. BRX8-8]AOW77281.1 alternative ribosome-rescue factor [Colwellia sp. PAMC 20917]MBA6347825.1 ribosome alternative rescue factor ArfA [Colwellia sp. BRX8-9]MBA6351818.1 ribosome alternative rescue factor ArfA [Colwellia sp. BRX9-1]MBA6370066.1 ribosome alternative rescue factor ArfA [Colwellia sp. BRX8-4]|tara:strand:- start:2214 stop:2417 length:204 start_codon:yes stop_codon:yes gene_type:complete
MSKNKQGQVLQNTLATDLGRGKIKDNFFAALVTSKVYKLQVVQAKKGKGSFKRSNKHQGREPYLMNA